ncbi:hypothetical protein M8C21_001888 [Ambrosia artemisiifolia]|uniref:DUF7049 domain-containing protein n=1 Tax=Ambrosia artemisiifolia TaxID=4212 RepID=A0AAD5DF80_AMBAR|nr:hypothetical protein M8C21_001888 [Ambrosia artemisiifolia]
MDKASVLSNIKDYIASLTSQVEELNKRNKILENELPRNQILHHDSGERLNVRIVDLDQSTSDLQVVDLEVTVSRNLMLSDLVVRVLEFMKQVKNITITSIDAGTRMSETEVTMNQVILRLRIQGSEWNRSSFQEALTRVLDDLAQ